MEKNDATFRDCNHCMTEAEHVTPWQTFCCRCYVLYHPRQDPLQGFVSSLVNERADGAQATETELAMIKNKLRMGREKERKQKLRMRGMTTDLQAMRGERRRPPGG